MQSSITEVLYQQSSLTESLIQKNSFADGYKLAVENMIKSYFNEVGMSTIDDKYYINLEDLLRYVNTTFKDQSMANFIYVSLKEYLKTILNPEEQPKDIFVIEKKPISRFKTDRRYLQQKYNLL